MGMWDRPQRHQPRTYQSLLEPMHFIADTRLKVLAPCGILPIIHFVCAKFININARFIIKIMVSGMLYHAVWQIQ